MAGKALGQSTADLENQRDAQISSLSQIVGVNVLTQANGDVLLSTSTGTTLPIHGTANPLATTGASAEPGAFYPGGGIPAITLGGADVTAALTGGQLGANIALRDTTLPTYQAELDEFSQNMAASFSTQGLPLFTNAAGKVPTGTGGPAQSGYVGFAAEIQVNPAVSANPAAVRDGLPSLNAAGVAGFPTLINGVLDNVLGTAPIVGTHVTALGATGTLNAPYSAPATLADFASTLVSAQSAGSAAVVLAARDRTGRADDACRQAEHRDRGEHGYRDVRHDRLAECIWREREDHRRRAVDVHDLARDGGPNERRIWRARRPANTG